jgi:hypothetical protein
MLLCDNKLKIYNHLLLFSYIIVYYKVDNHALSQDVEQDGDVRAAAPPALFCLPNCIEVRQNHPNPR